MKPLLEKPPLKNYLIMLVLGVMVLGSCFALEWDFESLASPENREAAWDRLADFLSAFSTPDRSYDFMQEVYRNAFDTIAIAVLGVAIAAVLAFGLALGASQRVMVNGTGPKAWLQRTIVEGFRVILDTLRGVPDFVWAIMLVAVVGLGPMAGLIAIVLNVTGILGKMYSELWDNQRPARYEALRVTGVGRVKLLLYGLQPLSGRGMISFTLMRTECAVRNASVIGIVGGGGLGSAMKEELGYGEWGRVATLLIAMILVTAGTDLVSNFLRYQLRHDPNQQGRGRSTPRGQITRRYLGIAAFMGLILWCVTRLWEPLVDAAGRLFDGDRWQMLYDIFGGLLSPDLGSEALLVSWKSALIPVAIAVIGTLLGVLGAAALAYPSSRSMNTGAKNYTGEDYNPSRDLYRRLRMFVARAIALLARAIPEVSWVLILVSIFTVSILPGILAIGIHSAGVLARVFTESIDDHPYRYYERNYLGSRPTTFVYAGVTRSWRDWLTYSFFQFESNVRLGVVLGMVGLSGLGFRFKWAWEFWQLETAATHLITMVILTIIIDRISRALKISRIAR